MSFKGGSKTPIVALKHVEQINYLLQATENDISEGEFVLKLGDIINQKLKEKTWAPNTVRTYINSLALFAGFCKTMLALGIPRYCHFTAGQLEALQSQLTNFRKSCVKLAYRRELEKEEDAGKKVNPDDISAYLGSERVKETRALLQRPPPIMRMGSYTQVRNYLLFRLALSNCSRLGVLKNVTLKEMTEARLKRETYVVKVADHKTCKTSGPAELIVPEDVYRHITQFIKLFRQPSSNPEVFVNWTGSKMDSSTVTNALTTELGQAGVGKRY